MCPNCGAAISHNFCPMCGQPASISGRITGKVFVKALFESFTRLSKKLFFTLGVLLTRPWVVIRDYIHGQRTRYTSPFTLAIQVTFILSIIYLVINEISGSELYHDQKISGEYHWLVRLLFSSQFVQTLISTIPLTISLWVAYLPFGSRRFNVYEYVVAVMFFLIMSSTYSAVFTVAKLAFGLPHWIGIPASMLMTFGMGIACIFKAFPIRQWWKRWGMLLWFAFISCIFILIYGAVVIPIVSGTSILDFN